MAITAFDLSIAEWALVFAAIIGALEVFGFSRSSRTLRRLNADLRERTAMLEGEVNTRDERIAALEAKVAMLEHQVEDLKARSVDALFTALREHDTRVSSAWADVTGGLSQLGDSIALHEDQAQDRHLAMLDVMERIAQTVAGRPEP